MASSRKISYGRTNAYAIQYHIVFCTKYRKRIFTKTIMEDLIDIIENISEKANWSIDTINGEEDHLHILINATPQDFIPNIVKSLKGPASRELFKKHPEIKERLWGGHLWSPSYFVATTSENTADQIRTYIETQGSK